MTKTIAAKDIISREDTVAWGRYAGEPCRHYVIGPYEPDARAGNTPFAQLPEEVRDEIVEYLEEDPNHLAAVSRHDGRGLVAPMRLVDLTSYYDRFAGHQDGFY